MTSKKVCLKELKATSGLFANFNNKTSSTTGWTISDDTPYFVGCIESVGG